jgi:hypothetical protein
MMQQRSEPRRKSISTAFTRATPTSSRRSSIRRAALTWEENGVLTPLPRDQWLEAVRNRPSAKARGLARQDEILQIDQASPTMAFVKLKCAIPPRFFTDYLNFLRVDGKWQIAQKVFATEIRE